MSKIEKLSDPGEYRVHNDGHGGVYTDYEDNLHQKVNDLVAEVNRLRTDLDDTSAFLKIHMNAHGRHVGRT